MALYIGIDIGGTAIKGVVIDENGKLYGEDSVVTVRGEEIVNGIAALCNRLSRQNGGRIAGDRKSVV